ncbi:hypothetical protein JCGZ_12767 [Jatropha curcas]|uniref:Uncharacterized protein n=1 Tax=Jatropha curcas TaxID=180498 RepID=A0A067KRM4_JATCU|nr:uncharacterized protein LOC105637252 [Jatropha curcas]KDP34484.1 hypothetical protein JCGZ_12767 [Jatropha curcas]
MHIVSSMNPMLLASPPNLQLPSCHSSPCHQLQPQYVPSSFVSHRVHFVSSLSCSFPSSLRLSLCTHQSLIGAAIPSDEGPISAITFEDFIEKDWSFLDLDDINSEEEHKQKISQIISAGEVEDTSRVLVSIGSEEFVDQLVDTLPYSFLLVVHDSLFLLACIKEKYDKVKCWQGELIHVPEKWGPFDVVFLYFLPALPFKLDQVFGTLAKHCSQGARVVISHLQGREGLEQLKKQYQDVVVSELPDKMTLQKVAADNAFEMAEFVDEPRFYVAVLRFSGKII